MLCQLVWEIKAVRFSMTLKEMAKFMSFVQTYTSNYFKSLKSVSAVSAFMILMILPKRNSRIQPSIALICLHINQDHLLMNPTQMKVVERYLHHIQ